MGATIRTPGRSRTGGRERDDDNRGGKPRPTRGTRGRSRSAIDEAAMDAALHRRRRGDNRGRGVARERGRDGRDHRRLRARHPRRPLCGRNVLAATGGHRAPERRDHPRGARRARRRAAQRPGRQSSRDAASTRSGTRRRVRGTQRHRARVPHAQRHVMVEPMGPGQDSDRRRLVRLSEHLQRQPRWLRQRCEGRGRRHRDPRDSSRPERRARPHRARRQLHQPVFDVRRRNDRRRLRTRHARRGKHRCDHEQRHGRGRRGVQLVLDPREGPEQQWVGHGRRGRQRHPVGRATRRQGGEPEPWWRVQRHAVQRGEPGREHLRRDGHRGRRQLVVLEPVVSGRLPRRARHLRN